MPLPGKNAPPGRERAVFRLWTIVHTPVGMFSMAPLTDDVAATAVPLSDAIAFGLLIDVVGLAVTIAGGLAITLAWAARR